MRAPKILSCFIFKKIMAHPNSEFTLSSKFLTTILGIKWHNSYSAAKTHLHIPDEGFQTGGTPTLPSSGQKRHHLWLGKAGSELHVTYEQRDTYKSKMKAIRIKGTS